MNKRVFNILLMLNFKCSKKKQLPSHFGVERKLLKL